MPHITSFGVGKSLAVWKSCTYCFIQNCMCMVDYRQTPKSCAKEVHDALNQKAATCRYMQMTKHDNEIPNMCTNLLQHESDCTADFFIHRQTDWSQLQHTYIHTAKHLWPTSYANYYNNNNTRPNGVCTHIMPCKSLGNTHCSVKNIEFICNVYRDDDDEILENEL